MSERLFHFKDNMPRKYSRVRRSSKKKMRSGVTRNLRLTNQTIHQAVRDYLGGGARKKDIVDKYGEISNWDVSNVTNMHGMFKNAHSFNQPLNKWNVSKVETMGRMFWHAESFNQPLNNWNVSNVTNMWYMFDGASSFNQPLNKWNVSNDVTYMRRMFDGADSFNQPLHAPWYYDSEESDSE